ncbi:MAG: TonB-dependent receptor [Wenzhouxiangellaceae bacterium]|nr:TonB-dependent receptor [Wenzhouxiangellaceae bacterium]
MEPLLRKSRLALAVSAAIAIAPLSLLAQDRVSDAEGESPTVEQPDTIVVTGSRLARSERSAAVPVQAVSADSIQFSGETNLEQVLNELPQFVPGTTAASNSLASATGTGAATLDLRGLGSARNLVLVNGRRYVFFDSTQVTNINTIPAALVERVEVVTGGASAVYGSDAVAGVVNFILKDDYEGVEARAQVHRDSRGDGWIQDYTVTMGGNFDGGRGNAVISINYLDRDKIDSDDRGFSTVVLGDGRVDGVPTLLPVGSNAAVGSSFVPFGRFSGLPFGANAAAVPGLEDALAAAGLGGLGALGFIPDESGRNVRPFSNPDRFNYAEDNFLRVPQERWTITAMGRYDLSNDIEAYTEASYSYNETTVGFASSFINSTLPIEVDNPFIGEPLREVFRIIDANQAGAAANDGIVPLGIQRRLSEVGPRLNRDERDAWRVLGGIRGELGDAGGDWFTNNSFDLYYSFARSDNTQIQIGNVSLSRFSEGLLSGSGPGGQPAVNPFGPNISEAGVDFIAVTSSNSDVTELQVAAGTLTTQVTDLPAGPLGASLGFEWRSSSVDFRPDDLLARGDVAGFNPINATDGEIDVWEVFAEVSVPVLADLPGVELLSLRGAGRYSDYDLDRVGGVWTYFGGVDWEITPELSLGGQFQRAIRAPNVGEAFGGQRQFPIQATDPCARPGAESDPTLNQLCIASGVPAGLVGNAAVQPNQEVPGLFGGNPDLGEETSDTFTLSAIWQPAFVEGLRVTIDYFDIEVEDAIAPLAGGVGSILNLCFNQLQDINSTACQAVSRNPETGVIQSPFLVEALNENIGKLETSGIDFQVNYGFEAGFGLLSDFSRFDLQFVGTWVDEFTLTPLQDLPEITNKCVGAFGSGICGEPRPEFKTFTSLTWTTGALSLNLRHRWLDSVKLDRIVIPARRGESGPSAADFPVPKFDSEQYVDLSFNYDLSERFSFWGGINNVFDNKPPLIGANQRRANTFPDTFDPIGTEFYVGAAVRL